LRWEAGSVEGVDVERQSILPLQLRQQRSEGGNQDEEHDESAADHGTPVAEQLRPDRSGIGVARRVHGVGISPHVDGHG